MTIFMSHRRKLAWMVALPAAVLVIAGCAEIRPYEAPNHREEGPAKGLFTGSQGEWVIVGPKSPPTKSEENQNGAPESETQREVKKDPAKPAANEQ